MERPPPPNPPFIYDLIFDQSLKDPPPFPCSLLHLLREGCSLGIAFPPLWAQELVTHFGSSPALARCGALPLPTPAHLSLAALPRPHSHRPRRIQSRHGARRCEVTARPGTGGKEGQCSQDSGKPGLWDIRKDAMGAQGTVWEAQSELLSTNSPPTWVPCGTLQTGRVNLCCPGEGHWTRRPVEGVCAGITSLIFWVLRGQEPTGSYDTPTPPPRP